MATAPAGYETSFVVYVNTVQYSLDGIEPTTTLLEWLRDNGLTGTKLGCGEGGCGACTVMISHFDAESDSIVHRPCNACITPVCAVATMHVTTVEGIGSVKKGLHPVQEALASAHGSQCGFCTPGIVMSMYTLLRNHPKPTAEQIESAFDGNLCRCTGYRPILQGFRKFACPAGENCCQSGGSGGCGGSGDPGAVESTATAVAAAASLPYNPETQDPIFPPALRTADAVKPLYVAGERSVWYRPTELGELLSLKAAHTDAKIVVGSSELAIERKFKGSEFPVYITPTAVPELNTVTVEDDAVVFGAAVTVARVEETFAHLASELDRSKSYICDAATEMLRWFAGHQIRSMAAIGGNIATASPISDLNQLWLAQGATLKLVSAANPDGRTVSFVEWFTGYRKTAMAADEIIHSVRIPLNGPTEFTVAYKQARRRDDDIAIVNSAFRVSLEQADEGWVVADAGIGYGGMSWMTVGAARTIAFLKGKAWNADLLPGVYETLEADLPLADDAPGGQIAYRRSLTTGMFFKFYLFVCAELANRGLAPALAPAANELSAIELSSRPLSSSVQDFPAYNDPSIHQPVQHKAANLQVTGEAKYTDDVPSPPGTLFAEVVLSDYGHGTFTLDTAAAEAMDGVVAVITAADVPGSNVLGDIFPDEELFAVDTATCAGQLLALVVAETKDIAVRAGRAVVINWTEKREVITTIEAAIAANSYFDQYTSALSQGDVEAALASAPIVIEGEMKVGGQEHFYLETQATLAVPGEENEIVLFTSSQNPSKSQETAAHALGIPTNRVVVKVKRLGGGFGGKETRCCFVSAATSVAAFHVGRPVRIMLDRDKDMMSTGTRHPFYAKYKIGADEEGRILAADVDLYSNAGNSFDLSGPVMDRALFHIENSYNIPNLRAKGHLCKTNIPTNTAFRGFGGPQGMSVTETWMEQTARKVGKVPHEIQELNMYSDGDETPYGQVLEGVPLDRVWAQVKSTSDYDARRAEVDAFNAANRWRKRGLAMVPVKFGMSFTAKFMNQAGALVHVYMDGSVLVSHGGVEMGQGLHTKMAQVAAHSFGISVEDVHVCETATDKVSNTMPTAASVSADLNGAAILDACNQINARLEPLREKLGPEASFKDIVTAAHFERINLSANGFYKTPDVGFVFNGARGEGRPFNYYVVGVAVAEVEIDVLTGDHSVLRADICMDLGKSLNPALDIGQIEGGFAQGIGLFTLEELTFMPDGRLFTRGPSTYKIPGFHDVPADFRVGLLHDSQNPRALHSSKGVGEPPLFLGCSVFMAIKDALVSARTDAGHDPTVPFELYSPASSEKIRMAAQDSFTSQFTDGVQFTI